MTYHNYCGNLIDLIQLENQIFTFLKLLKPSDSQATGFIFFSFLSPMVEEAGETSFPLSLTICQMFCGGPNRTRITRKEHVRTSSV